MVKNGYHEKCAFPSTMEEWSTEYRDFGVTDATPQWVKNRLKTYYKEGNKQHIKNRLVKVKNWAYLHKMPLICNEWVCVPEKCSTRRFKCLF